MPVTKMIDGRRTRGQAYASYLRSPHWLALRDRVLQRDGHRCLACQSVHLLHVHHGTYARFGRERLSDLFTLCEPCHERLHKLVGVGRRGPRLLKATGNFIRTGGYSI